MPRSIYVTIDTKGTQADLAKIGKQVRFALSLALNNIAKLARDEQIAGIFDRFKVKKRAAARVRTTVALTKAARKSDLVATLTERDPWLVQHEEGDQRLPGDIYSSIVQPVSDKAKRIGVLYGANTPKAILATPYGFVARMKSGKVGVFRRRGKKRLPIDLVFALEREATIKKGLRFGATVDKVVTAKWEETFGAAMRKALETAT